MRDFCSYVSFDDDDIVFDNGVLLVVASSSVNILLSYYFVLTIGQVKQRRASSISRTQQKRGWERKEKAFMTPQKLTKILVRL